MIIKNGFNEQCITFSQMNLITNSRHVWRTMTTWSRAYLIGRYLGIGSEEALFARLFNETSNYGGMLRLVFGAQFSENFTWLLNEYTIAMRDLVSAQMEGNQEGVDRNLERLYSNAAQRANLLAQTNPFWDEATWRGMFETYMKYTIQMANALITDDYSKSVEAYKHLITFTSQIADYYAQGVFKFIAFNPLCPEGLGCAGIGPEEDGLPFMLRCMTRGQVESIYLLRMLLFEMEIWMRDYLISRYMGVGDTDVIIAQLNRVVGEFGEMLTNVFGTQATGGYLQLFHTHIDLIISLITAQIEGNGEAAAEITGLLYENAEQIASFLASLNPFWNETALRNNLFRYIQNTIEESLTFLTGEYDRNINIFAQALRRTESQGNYLALGLLRYMAM